MQTYSTRMKKSSIGKKQTNKGEDLDTGMAIPYTKPLPQAAATRAISEFQLAMA